MLSDPRAFSGWPLGMTRLEIGAMLVSDTTQLKTTVDSKEGHDPSLAYSLSILHQGAIYNFRSDGNWFVTLPESEWPGDESMHIDIKKDFDSTDPKIGNKK